MSEEITLVTKKAREGRGIGRIHEVISAGTAKTWTAQDRPTILYCNSEAGGTVVLTDQEGTVVSWLVPFAYELKVEAYGLGAGTTVDLIAVWE